MGKIIGSITGANAAQKAANEAAAKSEAAGRQAAMAQAFRPIGFTNTFGSSQFTLETDPATGLPRVTQAGYEISPELKALQEQLFGLAPGALAQAQEAQAFQPQVSQQAQQLFGLGSQYLSETPEAARQRFYNQQQALLEPTRQQEEQRLGASVFGRGRAGLNISGQGQPELAALAGARRQQDLALAAQAEQGAQQQIGFGQGLMAGGLGLQQSGYGLQTQALGPLQSYLGQIGAIEEMGQTPYQQSLQLAQLQSGIGGAAGATQANAISSAAQQRAQAAQQAAATNTAFLQAAIGAAAGGFGGFGGAAAGGGFGASIGNFLGNPLTALKYGTNLGSQQTRMLAAQDF